MLVLFTGQPGSGKTTVLTTFLKYLLEETKLRVCTVDLDYRTAKLTKILTPNVEALCDLHDVAEGSCNEVTHVVLSDRHVHIPVRVTKLRRQDGTILDLLEELHAVLKVDIVLVDSVEQQIAALADRGSFKIVHVVRPDVVEHCDYAKLEDIIVMNNVIPGLEPKLRRRHVLYPYFDSLFKVCSDISIIPLMLHKDVQEFCKRLLRALK